MTLQQIAINNSLSYSTVYIATKQAGILVKWKKNYEYDEQDVMMAVASYLSDRIRKHEKKIAELTADRNKVMKKIRDSL